MSSGRTRQRRARRGYTVVELMMAVGLFAVGVSGIAAMQRVTVAANQHAKNLGFANHIAQSWQERLAADAALWEANDQNLLGTRFLKIAETTNEWERPSYDNVTDFGAAFGPLGGVLSDTATDIAQSFFCTHVRITELADEVEPVRGNGVLRAEVRVFWPRDGRLGDLENHYCDPATLPTAIDISATDDFHFVHTVLAVRQSL